MTFCERNTFFLMILDLALVTIGWTFKTGGEDEIVGSGQIGNVYWCWERISKGGRQGINIKLTCTRQGNKSWWKT